MSFDLYIWSISRPSWSDVLPESERWQAVQDSMILQRPNWQLVAGPVSKVLPEDIPAEIMGMLPGIQYLIELNLEPIPAPASARRLLKQVAANIARAGVGVVQDPQEDSLTTPRGVKRFQRQAQPPRISLLTFSWWFKDGPLPGEAGYRQLLALLQSQLPEALPRRYGEYEPPQFLYRETGEDHFVDLLLGARLSPVWYPHYPVLSVHLGVSAGSGPTRQGYRASYFSIGLDSSVIQQPGWQLGLERFWREVSRFIRPFYGDVRLLHNHLYRQGRIFFDQQTEQHPVMNGWWNGVPSRLGQGVVLGDPYLALWPEFVKRAKTDGQLCFLSLDNWLADSSIERLVGGVPQGIAQGRYSDPLKGVMKRAYPPIWPFEAPFKTD